MTVKRNNISYNVRCAAASSKLADGRWLITGGVGIDGTLSSARAYSEAEGWVDFPSLPATRYWHCQVTVGHDVYVIGGWHDNHKPQSSVYILSEDQVWVKGKNLPTHLSEHSCAVIGSKIYVIGGYDHSKDLVTSVFILDTSAHGSSWELGPELPVPRAKAQTFVYDDTLYLLGGYIRESRSDVFTLAPGAQSWSVVPGANITDIRHIFPAPLITNDNMHCN